MKQKFKKMFALVTTFAMTLSLVAPNFAKAAEPEDNNITDASPVISVTTDKTELHRGDEVTATVSVDTKQVANLVTLQIYLAYDNNVFEPIDSEPKVKLDARKKTLIEYAYREKAPIAFYGLAVMEGGENFSWNGEMLSAKFKVKEDAKVGETSFYFANGDETKGQKDFITSLYEDAESSSQGKDPNASSETKKVPTKCVDTKVNVTAPLKSISFNKAAETSKINLGSSETLVVVYDPEDTTDDKTVTWNSDNPDAVTVDNGVVKAVGEGEATVTATVGNKVASIKYSVRIPLESITINGDDTMSKGDEKPLTVTYNPDNTTDDKTVTWESSDPACISIDQNGKMTAKRGGTATITATVGEIQATKDVSVIVHIDSVSLSGDDTILKNESKRLTAVIEPEDATDDRTVTWSSSNEDVLFVDQNGQMRGKKEGTATIKAVVAGKEATKDVTVQEIHINSISIDGEDQFEMIKNQTKNLKVNFDPENTTDDKNVTWTSTNEDVATVDENGNVKALKEGNAAIIASVGNFTDTVNVEVKEIHIDSVVINELDDTFTRGDEFKFSATYLPENATDDNKTVVWKSSDPNVGTIDENGNFIALSEGTTTITASIGNHAGVLRVNVKENHMTGFKLLQNEGEVLNIGGTSELVAQINPEDCTDMYQIAWSSSDESIATVDEYGNVKALKAGKVVINATVTTEYNEKFDDSIEINIPAKEVISNKDNGATNASETTSPKTGDTTVVLATVLMLGATITLVATKKRIAKEK